MAVRLMRVKVLVLEKQAFKGLEFLVDPPAGRRVYGPGEIIEMDDAVMSSVDALIGRGIIEEVDGLDNLPLARPAVCPSCGKSYINAPRTADICYLCGANALILPDQNDERSIE